MLAARPTTLLFTLLMCAFCSLGLHTITTEHPDHYLNEIETIAVYFPNSEIIKDSQKECENALFSSICNAPYRIQKVVLDAGHGGRDHGCLGHGSKEKDLVLKMATRLGTLIQLVYPEIEVIYTRKTDVFVPLYKRAAIANKAQADLFISIHCNAMPGNHVKVRGSETYVMGLHTANENLEVAKRENSAILLEDNYIENYGGYDPNSSEAHIFMSMFQNAYLEQSIQFAQAVEEQIHTHAGRRSRGVKQAGFVVLKHTAMPSVLVETGYLTNESDHRFLNSRQGQQQMAESIFNAFRKYKIEMEE